VAPSERIVLAGIGLGPRGQYDLGAMLPEKDVQFVAICDVQRSRREQVKQKADSHYGNQDCRMYADMFELLARPDIDAVLIATGDHWHALASLLAAKAVKDVYCEKPCGLTIGEIQLLADGIHRYGQAYQAGTQRRSISNFQYAVHLAQSGKLGRLHTLHASVYVPTKNYVPFGNRDPQYHTYTGTCPVRFEGDEGWVETGDD
jgi:predicted dehydrogenase